MVTSSRVMIWNDPSFGLDAMKPIGPLSRAGTAFPKTDCCFHARIPDWGGYSSPYDGEERSEIRRFHQLNRDCLLESAKERSREMFVFGLVVLTSAWPVIYMVVTVVKLLLKGPPLQ